jgi:hypothetical protein
MYFNHDYIHNTGFNKKHATAISSRFQMAKPYTEKFTQSPIIMPKGHSKFQVVLTGGLLLFKLL